MLSGNRSDCLVEAALKAQQRIARSLRAATAPAWLQLDLTIAQVKGLFYVAATGRATVGELARALGIGQPASSTLVERLVQVGLVRRAEDPCDRRRAIVQLTGRGEALVEQLEQAGRERWRSWLSQLSDEDLSALLQGLRALAELAETEAGRDPPGRSRGRQGLIDHALEAAKVTSLRAFRSYRADPHSRSVERQRAAAAHEPIDGGTSGTDHVHATPPRASASSQSMGETLSPERRMLVLAAVMLGMLLASLDQTIVGTAMPRVIAELNGLEHYAWVFTAYMLASTVMVPIYGKLSDIYGRKPFFLGGMAIFLLGSALSGTSQTMTQLIIFRAIQGLGAGAMMPISQAIIGDIFSPAERGKWQGVMMAVFGFSSIVGPTLGGWITDNWGWRWVFYVNMPGRRRRR